MSHLGNHRVNAARSRANKARQELAALNRQIADAILAGDENRAQELGRKKAYTLLNSLIP